jgi:hypothetical protein
VAWIEFEKALIAFARDEALDLDELDGLARPTDHDETDSIVHIYMMADRAMHARASGDTQTLVRACRRLADVAVKYTALEDDFPHLWPWAVEWCVYAGDFGAARELLRHVSDVPPARLSPLLAAELPRLQGTVDALDPASTASPAEVETQLLRGIELLDEFGAVPARARAQATLGAWLARQDRPQEAAQYLAAARETFTELRATAWLRELDAAAPLSAAG